MSSADQYRCVTGHVLTTRVRQPRFEFTTRLTTCQLTIYATIYLYFPLPCRTSTLSGRRCWIVIACPRSPTNPIYAWRRPIRKIWIRKRIVTSYPVALIGILSYSRCSSNSRVRARKLQPRLQRQLSPAAQTGKFIFETRDIEFSRSIIFLKK